VTVTLIWSVAVAPLLSVTFSSNVSAVVLDTLGAVNRGWEVFAFVMETVGHESCRHA